MPGICTVSNNDPHAVSQHAPVVKRLFSFLPAEAQLTTIWPTSGTIPTLANETGFTSSAYLQLMQFFYYFVFLRTFHFLHLTMNATLNALFLSTISSQFDFILITECLWSPVAEKIVIPVQQQGKRSRDPQLDEFIRSVGQLGQLIMLLSWRQEGERSREEEARDRGGSELR